MYEIQENVIGKKGKREKKTHMELAYRDLKITMITVY